MIERKIDSLLAEYGESHQNKTNKLIHWICVPVIVWCVMALIYAIPFFMEKPGLNWLSITLVLVIIYYIFLSRPLSIGFILVAGISYWSILAYNSLFSIPIWQFSLGLFVLAWIGQFWGLKLVNK